MKLIAASKAADSVRQRYAEIENSAWNLGYNMFLDSNLNLSFTNSDDKMPQLTLTKMVDNDDIYYCVEVKCPVLKSGPYDYADSIEYHMKRFYEVGKFITEINRFIYNPNNYED